MLAQMNGRRILFFKWFYPISIQHNRHLPVNVSRSTVCFFLASRIVHLDGNAVLTDEVVQGIVNFCSSGKHHFGAGVTTFTNDGVNNWVTSIIDSARIAEDLGKTRFQFKILHKPLLVWKGSFYVTNYDVRTEGARCLHG